MTSHPQALQNIIYVTIAKPYHNTCPKKIIYLPFFTTYLTKHTQKILLKIIKTICLKIDTFGPKLASID